MVAEQLDVPATERPEESLAVDAALNALETRNRAAAQLVKLR